MYWLEKGSRVVVTWLDNDQGLKVGDVGTLTTNARDDIDTNVEVLFDNGIDCLILVGKLEIYEDDPKKVTL